MSVVDDTVRALREAANLLDKIPGDLRHRGMVRGSLSSHELRAEASAIEKRVADIRKALQEIDEHSEIDVTKKNVFEPEE